MNLDRLRRTIRKHEGFRSRPYKDTEGILTVGYGFNLEDGLTREDAENLLERKVRDCRTSTRACVRNFVLLSSQRQEVLVEMMYELGVPRFMKFVKMLAAVESELFDVAADEILDSKLGREQAPARAENYAARMRVG